jgi:hypothetical protein
MKQLLLLASLFTLSSSFAQSPPVTWNPSCTSGILNLYTHACLVEAGSSSVTSFNSRTGAVVPVAGDYPYNLINGGTSTAVPFFNGSGAFSQDPTNFNYTSGTKTLEVNGSIVDASGLGIVFDGSGDITLGGALYLNSNPTLPFQAASKNYVDSLVNGLNWKNPVAAATTTTLPSYTYANGTFGIGATITFTHLTCPTLDTVSPLINQRLLIKNEVSGNAPYNGIYSITQLGATGVTDCIYTRTADANNSSAMNQATVQVSGGTQNNLAFTQVTPGTISIGTTPISFVQSLGTVYSASGQGILLTGSSFSLQLDGSTLSQSGTGVKVATGGITNNELFGSITRSKLASGTAYDWVTNDSGGVMSQTAVTANRAVVTDANGLPAASSTTATQVGYLSTSTSDIQTQLNGKQSTLSFIDSLVNTGGSVSLVGDTATPGASKYYGTNAGATLGYYNLPSGSVTSVSNADGTLILSPTSGAVVASRSAITGDISISAGSNASTLATVNSNVGSFTVGSFTVNGKGLITAASSGTTGNLTDVGTDGITIGSGTGAVLGSGTTISQHVADTTHAGYLSAADWNTFNGKGSGTVTSVSFSDASTSPIFNISGSPVTSSGTLTETLATQTANKVFAGPTTGAAAQPTFRSLVGADLPNPSASTLGGVESLASVSHNFLTSISTSGVPTQAQPNFTDISGTATVSQGGTGATTFSTGLPLIGNGTSAVSTGTVSGNTTKFATTTGSLTSGDCVKLDANGNFIDAGAACGGGGGSVSIDALTAATVNNITFGSTFTFTGSSGTLQKITLTGNATMSFASVAIGIPYTLVVTQDGTGSRVLTWPTVKVAYKGNGAPPISTAANSIDIYHILYDGTNYYVDYALGYN